MNNTVRLVGKRSNWPTALLTIAIIALLIWLLAWASEQGYLNNLLGGQGNTQTQTQQQQGL